MHLELHTHDLDAASAFYRELLHWRPEDIVVRCGAYHALTVGGALDAGIVQCGTRPGTWLPYAQVDEIQAATELGRSLGASVLLAPREGPAGWRSVLATSAAGQIALWQPKPRARWAAR